MLRLGGMVWIDGYPRDGPCARRVPCGRELVSLPAFALSGMQRSRAWCGTPS